MILWIRNIGGKVGRNQLYLYYTMLNFFSRGKNPRQWVVQQIFGLIWLQLRTISPLFASWCYCYNGCLLQSSSFFSGQHCVVNRPPTSFFMWPLEVFKWRFKKGKWGLPSASLKNELPWHFFHHWPAYLLSIHAYLISYF